MSSAAAVRAMGGKEVVAQIGGQPPISEALSDQALAAELGLKEITDTSALFDAARTAFQRASRSLVESGVRFKQLKALLPHGEFESFVGDKGFAPRRATEAMRAVDVVALLPSGERKALLAAPPSKLILLSRMKDAELDLLARSDEFESVIELPDSDLRHLLKKLKLARYVAQAKRAMAGEGDDFPETVWLPPAQQPVALSIVTSEALGEATRARVCHERLLKTCDELLLSVDDNFETDRVELIAGMLGVLDAVQEIQAKLRHVLEVRFSASKAFAQPGPAQVRCHALIAQAEKVAQAEADASLQERGRVRARVFKWKGAPPKSLAAVIAQALKPNAVPESDE